MFFFKLKDNNISTHLTYRKHSTVVATKCDRLGTKITVTINLLIAISK
jgi:hypothetical protein